MKPLRFFPDLKGKEPAVVVLCRVWNGTIRQGQVAAAILPWSALHATSWPSCHSQLTTGELIVANTLCGLPFNCPEASIGPECICANSYESSSLCPCDTNIPQVILAPNRGSGAIQVAFKAFDTIGPSYLQDCLLSSTSAYPMHSHTDGMLQFSSL